MRSSPSCAALSPPPPAPSLALELFVAALRDTSLALPSRSSDKLACKLSGADWPEEAVEKDQLVIPWGGGTGGIFGGTTVTTVTRGARFPEGVMRLKESCVRGARCFRVSLECVPLYNCFSH